jgi:predicted DCC family thiol-disulfide oxidoreductase YuxK
MTFQQVLMFDGDCVMCNSTVHFVANRDRAGAIRFASLQSRFADNVAAEHGASFPRDLSTVVLFDTERHVWYTKSEAALRTLSQLAWPWSWFGIVLRLCVPLCVRDVVYDFIARNRYRWFGKHENVRENENEARQEKENEREKESDTVVVMQEDGEICRFRPIVRERTIDNAPYRRTHQ